jgi:hypothetical protein
MKYKKIAGKLTKAAKTATTVAKVATPLYKYRDEIATGAKYAAKGANFLVKNQDKIMAASRYAQKYAGGGNISIPGAVVDATLGIAKRKAEKYADKKLGKYKAYRVAKAGFDTMYDVGTGNPMAALKHGTQLYAEIDPNKKRAAKVSGVVNGATGLASGLMRGDALGAYQGASQLYSTVDPNKKRVEKFNNIKSNYLDPTVGLGAASYSLANQTSKSNKSLNEKKFIV